MIGSLLDDVLDRTVVAGFTNVGYRVRSRGWGASELPRMPGQSGAGHGRELGLGLAAAEGFARLGATVWLVVRGRERGEQARTWIAERSGNGDMHVGVRDLSELESVRQFAERFLRPGVSPRRAGQQRRGDDRSASKFRPMGSSSRSRPTSSARSCSRTC